MNAHKEEETGGKYREISVRKKEMTNTLQKARKRKTRKNEGRKWWNQERMIKEQNEGKHTKAI
jgi:hypothetical protein